MLARLLVPALALALTATVHAAPRTCTRLPPPNALFFGEMIEPDIRGLTTDECESRCAADGSCVAFNWVPGATDASCVLYSLVGIGAQAPGSSQTLIAGRCGPNVPTVNGDFPGIDLGNTPAEDSTQCSYACEKASGCLAYSWTNYKNGTCWMKKALVVAASAPFDGSVTSGAVFKCVPVSGDADIVGGDFMSVPRADWRECCSVCLSTPPCLASSWSDYNGGTCWLKKDFSKKNLTVAKGVRAVVTINAWF